MKRTRIKMCGLTRACDVQAAVDAGADAIGLVLYPPSPRAVTPEQARMLASALPPFVTPVLLLVNPSPRELAAAVAAVPQALLQFHGDETPEQCQAAQRPFIRAARVPAGPAGAGFDLLKYAQDYAGAQALLLDAHVQGYGGGGVAFDWAAFDWSHPALQTPKRLVLAGGLTPDNVASAIAQVGPWAVDVSSGIEASKGVKDPARMRAFVEAVRQADHGLAARV